MRKILFFCLGFANTTLAQTNEFSESFIFFPKNMSINLPSYCGIDADVQGNIAYRSYLGQLSAIRTYVADFNYNVQKKSKTFPDFNKHIVGAGIYSDREGDFINRNRLFLRYVWHTRISESFHLSGGTSLHVINYIFKASSAGASGSDFAWSGNVSTALYSSTFRLGVSVNDFNQPSLTPIDVPSIVYRYYTIHSEKKISLGANTQFIASARTNIIPEGYSTLMAHLGISFQEKIGLHGFAHNNQGWGIAIDLNHLEVDDSFFDVSFAYRIPYSFGYRIPYSAFEVNLGYYLARENPKFSEE